MAIVQKPKLEEIKLPEEPGLLGGWGSKFETVLVRFTIRCFNALIDPFVSAVDKTIDWFLERVKEETKPFGKPLLDRIRSIPGLPDEYRQILDETEGTPAIPVIAIIIGTAIGAAIQLALGLGAPIYRLGQYEVDHLVHSSRMSPAEAYQAKIRGALGLEDYNKQFDHGGWSDELRTAWEAILKPLMGIGDLGTLYTRGDLDETQFTDALVKRGYDVLDIGKIKALLRVIPPLSDIIRMSVREAFTPDVVSKFQLHAELPGEMVSWAKKQGLSEDWAKAYWAAHWELPSLTMGFEMLHRGEITESDMQLLIKTHDVSPFWRDKLMAISYTPYTRVDVRRMYEVGILDQKGVYRSYRDLGYDDEKATNMTAFTIALSNAQERDLTKSEVITGFKIGYFREDETRSQLVALGYSEEEADYYISKVLYDLWQAEIKEIVKYLEDEYVTGLSSETDVYAKLGQLNLPASQINTYLRQWDIKKQAKTKTLTADKLYTLLGSGVITEDEYRTEMSAIRYNEKYINWLIELYHIETGV